MRLIRDSSGTWARADPWDKFLPYDSDYTVSPLPQGHSHPLTESTYSFLASLHYQEAHQSHLQKNIWQIHPTSRPDTQVACNAGLCRWESATGWLEHWLLSKAQGLLRHLQSRLFFRNSPGWSLQALHCGLSPSLQVDGGHVLETNMFSLSFWKDRSVTSWAILYSWHLTFLIPHSQLHSSQTSCSSSFPDLQAHPYPRLCS